MASLADETLDLIAGLQNSPHACLLTDAFPSFLSYVDAEHRYQFVNRAYRDRLGLERDAILGRTLEEIWESPTLEIIAANVDRGLAGESFTVEYRHADLGSLTSYVPHEVPGKGVLGVIVFSQDAREIQAARSELQHAEKMATLGRLVAAIMHDLNTPLAVLKSGRDLLGRALDKLDIPDKARSRVLSILAPGNQAIDRIDRTLEELRRLVRLDQAQRQSVDPRECVESALALSVTQIDATVTVENHLGDLPSITCEPAALTQLFWSVLRVAAANVSDNGTITLESAVRDEAVRFDLVFDGEMPIPSLQPAAGDVDGYELGAATDIARRHEGELRFEAEDNRSRFVLTLPLSS